MSGTFTAPSASDGSDRIERVPVKTAKVEMWLGGAYNDTRCWMLHKSGRVVPVTGPVPDPKIERQFMAHDGDGEITLKVLFGHRPLRDAELEFPTEAVLNTLIEREAREIKNLYKDSSEEFVEGKQAERRKIISLACAKQKAEVAEKRAERTRQEEDALLARADEIRNRRKKKETTS